MQKCPEYFRRRNEQLMELRLGALSRTDDFKIIIQFTIIKLSNLTQ